MFFFYAYRSVLARGRANLMTLLSVALFITGSLMGVIVYLSLRAELVASTPADIILAREAAETRPMDADTVRKIALVDGIKKADDGALVSAEMIGRLKLNTEVTFTMRGIDDKSMAVHSVRIIDGVAPQLGTLELLIGRKLLSQYPQFKIGFDVGLPAGPSKIVGVFAAPDSVLETEFLMHRPALERHYKRQSIDEIVLVAQSAAQAQATVDRLNANKDLNVNATLLKNERADEADLERLLRLVLILLILLAVVATVAIAATMNASVALRLSEMAALVAIGIRRSTLARMVVVESLLLTAIGTVLGIVASEGLRRAVGFVPQSYLYPIELISTPIVPLIGVGIGIVVGILGGIWPSFAVRRIDVTSMLR